MVGFSDGGLLEAGTTAPKTAKDFLLALPQGAYTSCRTLGGARPGAKIMMLAFQIARLEQSMRLLFPALDLDLAATESASAEIGFGVGVVEGSHAHLLPQAMIGSAHALPALRIFFAGEKDSVGLVAAEEAAKILAAGYGQGETELINMQGCDASRLVDSFSAISRNICVFLVECDGDGDLSFPAKKMLRSLKSSSASSYQALSFAVLSISKSVCAFSSKQLGDAKFRGGHELDSLLSSRGGARLCRSAVLDVEMQDLEEGMRLWKTHLFAALQTLRDSGGGGSTSASPLLNFLQREIPKRIAEVLPAEADADASVDDAMIIVLSCPRLVGAGGCVTTVGDSGFTTVGDSEFITVGDAAAPHTHKEVGCGGVSLEGGGAGRWRLALAVRSC